VLLLLSTIEPARTMKNEDGWQAGNMPEPLGLDFRLKKRLVLQDARALYPDIQICLV
jgi:hypothetical protein